MTTLKDLLMDFAKDVTARIIVNDGDITDEEIEEVIKNYLGE